MNIEIEKNTKYKISIEFESDQDFINEYVEIIKSGKSNIANKLADYVFDNRGLYDLRETIRYGEMIKRDEKLEKLYEAGWKNYTADATPEYLFKVVDSNKLLMLKVSTEYETELDNITVVSKSDLK